MQLLPGSGLFKSDTKPPPPPPPPPKREDPAIAAARAKQQQAELRRKGRRSTILTSATKDIGEQLGVSVNRPKARSAELLGG